jgi:hypothetical protein
MTPTKDEIKVLIAANAQQVVNLLQAASQGRLQMQLSATDILSLLARATEHAAALNAMEAQEKAFAAKTIPVSAVGDETPKED